MGVASYRNSFITRDFPLSLVLNIRSYTGCIELLSIEQAGICHPVSEPNRTYIFITSFVCMYTESRFKAKVGGITPLKMPDPPAVQPVQPDMLV